MLPLVLGGLGAVGGALGAGALAGRYMPLLSKAAYEGADVLRSKASSGLRKTAQKVGATDFEGAGLGMLGTPARVLQERLSRAGAQVANIPLGAVPGIAAGAGIGASALTGGLAGGAALNYAGQLMEQQNVITDPEYPGRSSNTSMARASTPTLRYLG
jgi:hypothetical protein